MRTRFANDLELDFTAAKSQNSNCFYRWIMREIDLICKKNYSITFEKNARAQICFDSGCDEEENKQMKEDKDELKRVILKLEKNSSNNKCKTNWTRDREQQENHTVADFKWSQSVINMRIWRTLQFIHCVEALGEEKSWIKNLYNSSLQLIDHVKSDDRTKLKHLAFVSVIIKIKQRAHVFTESDTRKHNTRTDDKLHTSVVITGTNIIKCCKLKIIDSTNVLYFSTTVITFNWCCFPTLLEIIVNDFVYDFAHGCHRRVSVEG